ncbi:MAG: polysaccharide biosynthesis tyrosine autokinase [Pseudomonadota bacterium]
MNKQARFSMPRSMPFVGRAGAMVPGQEGGLDLKAIFTAVRKRFLLAVTVFLITFAAVAFYTLQQTPIYQSKTRLMLDTQQSNVFDLGSAFSGLAPNTAVIDTELEVIQSETMLTKVVDQLDLTRHAEYNYTMQEPSGFSKTVDDAKSFVKALIPGVGGGEDGDVGPPMTPEEEQQAIHAYAVWKLQRAIGVNRLGPTYIIDIRATAESPELAAEIANGVADQYIVEQLEAKLEAVRRENLWLSERLGTLKDEVNAKENAVEAKRAEEGILFAGQDTLTEQQIRDLTGQLTSAESRLQEAQSNLRAARASGGTDSTGALSSGVIANLKAQRADVQRRAADLATRYGPLHPERVAVNNELTDLDRQIASAVGQIVSNLEQEEEIAQTRVNDLRRRVNAARSVLIRNAAAGVEIRELEREAEAARLLYEDFLNKFQVSAEGEDLAQANARVLTQATPPGGQAAPKTMLNLILGLFFGGLAAGAGILAAELRENHFATGEEIERAFGVPAIGSVPLLLGRGRKNPGDYAIENPLSAYSESIRNIRASIVFADLDNPAKTVAICSSLPNEGKTMTTYSLGRLSALSGAKTLVIDGDFRRRQLTEAAKLDPDAGLIEHLFGEVALDDALHIDEATGMHVLPLTSTRNTPRDVFGSRAFDALLQRLDATYDLIVIDTGPLLLMAESRVIVSKVDQVIVVAKWRHTTRNALEQTMGILNQFNASIAGIALTFVDLRKRRFLGTSSASYKAYSKYYSEGGGK